MATQFSYHHLAVAYDALFPLDPQALAFVEGAMGGLSGRKVVDAGCGTGPLARALADRGASVFGFDIDPDLLARAQERAGGGLTVATGDLRTWSPPRDFGKPDVVVCFGNSIPHLTKAQDLDAFFSRCRRALSPAGNLLLQLLDYDYLRAISNMTLPTIEVGGWRFQRYYEIGFDGLWTFHTELSGNGGQSSNAFELCPWSKDELERALCRNGFVVTGCFGGFDLRPPGASLPLVLGASLGLE